VEGWQRRFDPDFQRARAERIGELRRLLEPLLEQRLALHESIDELTFAQALLPPDPAEPDAPVALPWWTNREPFDPQELSAEQARLAEVEQQIQPLQAELRRLTRQFWVTRKQIQDNKYDLSASRYRQGEAEEVYRPKAAKIVARLVELNQVIEAELTDLQETLDPFAPPGPGFSNKFDNGDIPF
jgi:type I restriction enzyme M protein